MARTLYPSAAHKPSRGASAAHDRHVARPPVLLAPEAVDRRWLGASLVVLFAAAVVHAVLALRYPLAPDETYYWEWSRRPALGYYDQGPLVAWWIRASCAVFGETVVGIRGGIVVAALATQAFILATARDLFGARAAFWSLVASSITVGSLAGGFVATYDPLVVLFWAAAVYCAVRALIFGSRSAWIGVGMSVGLGLLSKHTMALFPLCLGLAIATHPKLRRHLRWREPAVAALIAVAIFSPNVVWQSSHGWMTFRHLFLLGGGGSNQRFTRRIGDYVGSQAGLVTPVLFGYLLAATAWAARVGRRTDGAAIWLLLVASAPVLVLFLLMTFHTKVQANWAVCGWITPPLLLAAWQVRRSDRDGAGSHDDRAGAARPGHSAFDQPSSVIRQAGPLLALASAAVISLLVAWPALRVAAHVGIPARWDQMNRLYGGEELGAAVDHVRRSMIDEGVGRVAVGAVTYDTASRLAFYVAGKPRACCLFARTRANSYLLWNGEGRPAPGGAMALVDDYPIGDPRLAPFPALFNRVVMEPHAVTIRRPDLYKSPIHTYYLYRCYGYQPNSRIETPSGG